MRSTLAPVLACIALLTTPAAAQDGTPTVPIALSSFHIAPATIHLAAGRPVRLAFTNDSGSGHDFTAPGFFAASKIVAGSAPEGEVELRGHAATSVTLVPTRGTWRAHCSHFGHKLLGMSATIVVD
ncbi:MAG: cupredoxin domain-containing protein [Sphingomicrobium sp.]